MKVVTYINTAADAPPGHEAIALFFEPLRSGMATPVIIFGKTEEAAIEKAKAWLAAELERARPKPVKGKKPPAPTFEAEEAI